MPYVVPGTVREEFPPRRTARPVMVSRKPTTIPATTYSPANPTIIYSTSTSKSSSVYIPTRPRPTYTITSSTNAPPVMIPSKTTTTTAIDTAINHNAHDILLNAHPQDNEIADSVNIRHNQSPNVNVPYFVENSDHKETREAKLNLGAIVALGAFGGFVFLAAVITTIVILVRR